MRYRSSVGDRSGRSIRWVAAVACCVAALACLAGAAIAAETARPGLVFVLFNSTAFERPAGQGVEEQIAMELQGFNDCSKLWLGQIRFPEGAQVTLSAEADNGLRLFLDGKPVIDGWSPDGARAGTFRATDGRWVPLRLEYFQDGGAAFLRLFWEWPGHPRELVPAAAFGHTEADRRKALALAEGKESTGPGDQPPAMSASGDEEVCARLYQAGDGKRESGEPIRLDAGPHLFVDDYLVEQSAGLTRRVACPKRDPAIPNPVVTGKEDGCFQPYLTVLRDPETRRFRIWYGAAAVSKDGATSHIATMESEDGTHWLRPHRVLRDPAPIQFGVSVLDEGPRFADPAKRYKYGWWKDGGLKVAAAPDGLEWQPLSPNVVLRHNHDINNLFWDAPRKRYIATASVYTIGPTWKGLRRVTLHSASRDLLHWEKPWYVLTPVDGVDEGETQFYAMCGYLMRGGLWLGMVKVLRDDLRAEGTPEGSYGIGYTALAWSRDGRHWVRDREPFFQPDPQPGAWDHAHAWIDWQLPAGDEVYLYYGGYKNGHKVNRFEERQIGLVRIPRDRYVAREAGDTTGTLRTPPVTLAGRGLTVNAAVSGEMRVRLTGADGHPLPGHDFPDCAPITGDSLAHPVRWKARGLPKSPVHLEFSLRRAAVYGFEMVDVSSGCVMQTARGIMAGGIQGETYIQRIRMAWGQLVCRPMPRGRRREPGQD